MRPRPFDDAPFILFWETTRACDLVCAHCRACAVPERNPLELSTDEGKALLDEAAELGVKLLVLTGGDPAKREDLAELVRHGTARGLRMALTPSATPLVTTDWLQELREAGLARIAISIDGAHAESHDAFRAVPGTFARSMDILRDARRLGLTTQVNTTVCQHNLAELPDIARMMAELDIELWSVFFIVPTGRAGTDIMLSEQQTEEVFEWLADLAKTAPFDIKTTAAPHYRRVLLKRKHKRDDIVGLRDGIGRSPRGINDGQGVAFISHVGDIQPSGFLPVTCGNVRREGLTLTYQKSELFVALRDPDALGGKCGECEFRKVCGGSRARAFGMTGDALAEEPTCAYHPGKP